MNNSLAKSMHLVSMSALGFASLMLFALPVSANTEVKLFDSSSVPAFKAEWPTITWQESTTTGTLTSVQKLSREAQSRVRLDPRVLWLETVATEAYAPQSLSGKYHSRLLRFNFAQAYNKDELQAHILPALSQHTGVNFKLYKQSSLGLVVETNKRFTDNETYEQMVDVLSQHPALRSVERVAIARQLTTTAMTDPLYAYQWPLHHEKSGINIEQAWQIQRGANVVVAVIDTGFRPHPDLQYKTVPGYDFISDTDYSGDGDGRDANPEDSGDYVDYIDPDWNWPYTMPSSWHGTHVAGIIAANNNNREGIAGVSWGARIQPVRVLGTFGGTIDDIVDGMRWAAGLSVPGVSPNPQVVKVMNLSLGGEGSCDTKTQLAIDEILAKGVNIVVAAGNEDANVSTSWPANCKGVIAVAAGSIRGDIASYSNFGEKVKLLAPGGDGSRKDMSGQVISTLDAGLAGPSGPAYAGYVGTSMAAPHVAGVVALMLSQNPKLTPAQVIAHLQASASPFAERSLCASSDNACGAGRLNAHGAVARIANTLPESDLAYSGEFVRLVEYLHVNTDRYSYLSDPIEIAANDALISNPWKRTGQVLNAYALGGNVGLNWMAEPVCSYKASGFSGPYQVLSTAQDLCQAKRGTFDGYQFALTTAIEGTCLLGMQPLYKMIKVDQSGQAISHRYFASSLSYYEEEAKQNGWIGAGITFCTP